MSPLIGLQDITLHGGGRVLVRDLNLTVQPAQRWAVLGPNGAGKSTLLAVMAGLRAPVRGTVQLCGRDVRGLQAAELAPLRALMTDRWTDPFAASVLDTVLTARYRFGEADAHGRQLAQHGLAILDALALAQRDVRTLSRGERQRVGLATALAQDTPLLLLDEPTAHQDPRHQALVMKVLCGLDQTGRACVASVHDMNAAAAFATHVLLMTGCGPWYAGPAPEVLTEARLSEIFAVPIRAVSTDRSANSSANNGEDGSVVFTVAP